MRSRHYWAVEWQFTSQSARRSVHITRGSAENFVRGMRKTNAPDNFIVEPRVVQATKQDYLDQLSGNPEH